VRPFDKARRAAGRALLPWPDRRILDIASRELLPAAGDEPPVGHMGSVAESLQRTLDPQLQLLRRFEGPDFQELFAELRDDREINPGFGGRDYRAENLIHNGYYPTPDAELYAALILDTAPERIIEIGSGFSTAVARTAIRYGGLATQLHVIDPAPRRSVESLADRVEYTPVQASSLAEECVPTNSIVFVDSSHVTRSGGDGPFLYGSLLPDLPPSVLVHVHDIFLPYDYPRVYVERLYTEQYLLQALMANSTKYEPVLATYYLSREQAPAMRRVFGDAVARDGDFEGASFWMRTVA